ncbi:hypothetical protein Bpfe_017049, partial [Biomphalaria pfeifferi]
NVKSLTRASILTCYYTVEGNGCNLFTVTLALRSDQTTDVEVSARRSMSPIDLFVWQNMQKINMARRVNRIIMS